ncbi:MAG: Gfo/Idh/MocA family oxidoreductase [Gemmatimonadota bacterium]
MSESSPIKIGIVGCGAIAQIVHLPILAELEGATVSAVCDPDPRRAETVAGRFQIRSVCAGIDELLEHPDLQALIVCSPNYLHASHSEQALRAGKSVLCERPLGVSREQVTALLEAAGACGCTLMVAHNHRYRPDAWALRGFVDKGELGEIFHINGNWQRRRIRRPRRGDWRRDREQAGGGVLMDLGVTTLDLGLWLLGYPKPERVTAYLDDLDDDGLEDSAAVFLRLEGNLSFSVQVSWDLVASADRYSVVCLGTRGSGSLSPFAVEKESADGVVDVTPKLAPGTENVYTASYRRELDHFVSAVRGDSEVPLPREQAVLLGIVDACYRSAEEGREIVL